MSWATPAQVRERAPVAADVPDSALVRNIAAASGVLEGLSPIRPSRAVAVQPVACPCGTLLTGPYDRADTGAAGVAGSSPFYWRAGEDLIVGDSSCRHELVLPDNPVAVIDAVTVAGVVQDPTTYELVDARRLRRLGGASWATGDVRVDYRTGTLSELALRAVATLAAELVKAELGDRTCALPQRVQTISRQGVSMTVMDPQTFLDGGRTGLYLVDLFLAAARAPRRSFAVTSPDVQQYDRLRS